MSDMVERLRMIAEDGDVSVNDSNIIASAAREIETLRARLSQAGAGGVVDQRALDAARKEPITANCCQCGRIIDTREKAEGGDDFGCQLSDKRWVCSPECWDAVTEITPPATPVQPTASVEAVRHAVADAINRARYRGPAPGLPERGVDKEDPSSKEYAFRLADAALASLTPAPMQGDGGAKLCRHAPTYDAGLCCGHADDCTFIRPPAEREEPQ